MTYKTKRSKEYVSEAIEIEAEAYDVEAGLGWPSTKDKVIEIIQERAEARLGGCVLTWYEVSVGVQAYINRTG